MIRPFMATTWQEGAWFVSQCLEVDVASQGVTEEEEALANLKEALGLHFENPLLFPAMPMALQKPELANAQSCREVDERL